MPRPRIEPVESRVLLAFFGLDPTWGDGGFVTTSFRPASRSGIEFLKVLSDGKVLAAGQGESFPSTPAIVRYNSDATLNDTFGVSGIVSTPPVDSVFDATAQSDGKILIAGGGFDSQFVARYSADGVLDAAFGTNGFAKIDTGSKKNEIDLFPGDVAVQPDGKIILAARQRVFDSTTSTDSNNLLIARFAADGQPDSAFDGDGQLVVPLENVSMVGAAVVSSDGSILVAGTREQPTDPTNSGFIARLTSAGVLDTTFDEDGLVSFSFLSGKSTDNVPALALQDDGKILVGGGVAALPDRAGVARFNPDGSPDSSFGQSGIAAINIGSDADIWQFAIDPNDNILAVADSSEGVSVIRLTSSGNLDNSFAQGGRVRITDITRAHAIALADNGDIYIGRAGGFSVGRLSIRPDVELGADGTLRIAGTDSADTISIVANGANVKVTRNGSDTSFALADIKSVFINSGDGGDAINIGINVNSQIFTGAGNDSITAAAGIKSIDAGDGNNTIVIGAGKAAVNCGAGDDSITTGGGDMNITASDGNDSITTARGDDFIDAGEGDNSVISGSGNDEVSTGDGNDSISTTDGDDTIFPGAGNDTIDAGAGDDSIPGFARGTKIIDAGSGNDSIGDQNNSASIGDGSIDAGSGDDEVFAGADGKSVTIHGGAGNDSIVALGSATIFGDADDDFLHAIGTSSVIHGGDGRDIIRGSDAPDSLYGEGGPDYIRGSYGGDLLSGGGGNDRLLGQTGKDRLFGGAGNDKLDGGNSSDRLFGGDGNDTLFARDKQPDSLDGGQGSDTALADSGLDQLLNIEA